MEPTDLLMHPLRLRIVRSFLPDRQRTTSDLRSDLPDVPPATLYRHVAALAEGGVIEVAEERAVRGTVERCYRLRAGPISYTADDVAGLTVDEHRQAFVVFVATLLEDFDRYLRRGDVELGRDQIGYRQAALYLSDEEVAELLEDLRGVIARRLPLPAAPGRKRRLLSTVLMPADGDDGPAAAT